MHIAHAILPGIKTLALYDKYYYFTGRQKTSKSSDNWDGTNI